MNPLTRLRSLALAAGLVASLPAGAHAATVATDRSCYPNGADATLRGTGFAPYSGVSFTVNGKPLAANVTTDAEGAFEGTYEPPATRTESRLVLAATDSAGTSARAALRVTRRLRVTVAPPRGRNVRSWRAVFRLFGFGARRKAYVHYVGPNGELRRTVRLGRLRGPCGRLKTSKRRVLPFAHPGFGWWRLQFDTHRRYRPEAGAKRVRRVRVYRG
jgi:hypothetical protein